MQRQAELKGTPTLTNAQLAIWQRYRSLVDELQVLAQTTLDPVSRVLYAAMCVQQIETMRRIEKLGESGSKDH